MKIFHRLPLLELCAAVLFLDACTLEKEPEIPGSATNAINPVFDITATEVIPVGDSSFQVTVQLTNPGNLNIVHHGWVWDESPEPTIEDESNDLGNLSANSYSTSIPGLLPGQLYYLRPYITTGMGTTYGPEFCSFLGVNLTTNTGTKIYRGMRVRFTNTNAGNCSNCSYLWDFGDGTTSTEASPPAHQFNVLGTVTVRLTADIGGCKVSKSIVMEIADPFADYWVSITGGTYTMGCTPDQQPDCEEDGDETPAHQVTVSSFLMGKTEITQGQWLAVMGLSPDDNPVFFDQCGLDCPVESIKWNDVQVFLDKLNATLPPGAPPFRLPTESEWEYAARGGVDAAAMTKYAGSNNLELVAWYSGNSNGTPQRIAQKQPNGFGLYDMSGNVWEWVADDYHSSYTGAPTNESAWIDTPRAVERAMRGGSWKNPSEGCHVANRGHYSPNTILNYIGFRLARND